MVYLETNLFRTTRTSLRSYWSAKFEWINSTEIAGTFLQVTLKSSRIKQCKKLSFSGAQHVFSAWEWTFETACTCITNFELNLSCVGSCLGTSKTKCTQSCGQFCVVQKHTSLANFRGVEVLFTIGNRHNIVVCVLHLNRIFLGKKTLRFWNVRFWENRPKWGNDKGYTL